MNRPFTLPAGPALFLLLLVGFGIYDVARNKRLDRSVVKRYFLGNGILTWILSPFNALLDVLSLPYVNKGVYRLEDLPAAHQNEINRLIEASHRENLIAQLEERAREHARTMVFFKWYGANVAGGVRIPAFHERYRYVKTIGVSVFNKKQSTSKHFGPFRATLRVLYNINPMEDDSAYIDVGDVRNFWRTQPLFIFDDTLMHQSVNQSDKVRYCLFVDILRPSPFTPLLAIVVSGVRFFLRGVNYVFYKNWKVIEA